MKNVYLHDEVFASILYFVCILSLCIEEKGNSSTKGLYYKKSKKLNVFSSKYIIWISIIQCNWTLISIQMNHLFNRGNVHYVKR